MTPLEDLFDKWQNVEVRSTGKGLDVEYFECLHINCIPDADLSSSTFSLASLVATVEW